MNIAEMLVGNSYIPVASTSQLGIVSFYDEQFDVIDGKAYIKRKYLQDLFDDYSSNFKVSSELNNDVLTQNLYVSEKLISSTDVTLPFSNYVNNILLNKNGNIITLTGLNGETLLSNQQINLNDYVKSISVTKNGNQVNINLLNDSTLLSNDSFTLDDYGNGFSANKVDNDITFSLLNNGQILQTSTVNISDCVKNLNITRSGDTVTVKLLNGNNVISTGTFDIKDSLSVKDCKLEFTLDTSNYVMTAYLKDNNGAILTQTSVDFPLESVVVGADEQDGTITLTLQNGTTTSFYIGDLVSGLVSQSLYDSDKAYINNELLNLKIALGEYVNDIDALIGEGV